jgi:hypothetical protein
MRAERKKMQITSSGTVFCETFARIVKRASFVSGIDLEFAQCGTRPFSG